MLLIVRFEELTYQQASILPELAHMRGDVAPMGSARYCHVVGTLRQLRV
jgi:hypothetical protein